MTVTLLDQTNILIIKYYNNFSSLRTEQNEINKCTQEQYVTKSESYISSLLLHKVYKTKGA